MAVNLDKKAKSTSHQGNPGGGDRRGFNERPIPKRVATFEGPRSWAGLPSSGAKPKEIFSVGNPPSAKANSTRMRRIILEQSYRAGVGHIGSALSVVDILASLYDQVLRISSTDNPDRDRFVLSKGHAALALYSALHLRGWISDAEL